jgi:hypothetical protein
LRHSVCCQIAAKTLALRDGRPEALGFNLDRRRVYVGDPTTTLDAVFQAWQTDRRQGLDRSCWPRRVSWSAASTDAPRNMASRHQSRPVGRTGGEAPNQEPAAPRQSKRPGARPRPHKTSSDRCRPRAPSRVRAEPLKTSTHHNAGRGVSQDPLPNSSADQGRLLRGRDWQSGAG